MSNKTTVSKVLLILAGLGGIGIIGIAIGAVALAPSFKALSSIFEAANNGSSEGYETRRMLGRSMLPTLHDRDLLLIDKVSENLSSLQRRDIILFHPVDELRKLGYEAPFLQRIIGLPGETIEVKNGRVYINSKPLIEDYIDEAPNYTVELQTIPVDSYFVLGDRRNNSHDSHLWGVLPQQLIIGKVVSIYFPPSRARQFD